MKDSNKQEHSITYKINAHLGSSTMQMRPSSLSLSVSVLYFNRSVQTDYLVVSIVSTGCSPGTRSFIRSNMFFRIPVLDVMFASVFGPTPHLPFSPKPIVATSDPWLSMQMADGRLIPVSGIDQQ